MGKQYDLFESDEITITVGDCDDLEFGEGTFAIGNYSESITIDDTSAYYGGDLSFISDFKFDDTPRITIGKQSIDADLISKIRTLFDVLDQLDDDSDFKALFDTQLAFNKLRGSDED